MLRFRFRANRWAVVLVYPVVIVAAVSPTASQHCGLAARCEAGLCPAAATLFAFGLGPSFALCAIRAEPETGAEPMVQLPVNGGAEPRLTSGGVAAAPHSSWRNRNSAIGGAATQQLAEPPQSSWPNRNSEVDLLLVKGLKG